MLDCSVKFLRALRVVAPNLPAWSSNCVVGNSYACHVVDFGLGQPKSLPWSCWSDLCSDDDTFAPTATDST